MISLLKNFRRKKRVQLQLTALFRERGIDVMRLHPTVHAVVMKEAMLSNPHTAAERFFAISELFEQQGGSADHKAQVLLTYYERLGETLW
jgi:hypothetical protein